MRVDRFVVGLNGAGYTFDGVLRNLNLFDSIADNKELLAFIYWEITCQILDCVDVNLARAMTRLKYLPDYKNLEHIEQLRVPAKQATFIEAIQHYGLAIIFNINNKVGILANCDYYPESATRDYLVIARVNKPH